MLDFRLEGGMKYQPSTVLCPNFLVCNQRCESNLLLHDLYVIINNDLLISKLFFLS